MRSAEIIERINALPPMRARLMEVCGTHTMAIAKAGIKRLLPRAWSWSPARAALSA